MNALLFSGIFALASGCALTSKGPVLNPRFFSPALPEQASASLLPNGRSETQATSTAAPLELRLGSVEAASHLEERITYRKNASELGYYDDRRWTERPEEYLRRALERELFERRGIRRIFSGPADTLDVELTAFAELRSDPPRVRLALRFTLHDDRAALLERSFVVERALEPGASSDPADLVAAALGRALATAVSDLSDQVTRELATPPAAVADGGSGSSRECP